MVHRVVFREQRKYYAGVVQFQPASATIIDSLNVILVRKKSFSLHKMPVSKLYSVDRILLLDHLKITPVGGMFEKVYFTG